MQLEPKAVAALLCFIIQNGTAALILRYATSRSAPYSTQVAVLMSEMAVKLPISLVLYVIECGGLVKMCTSICTDVRTKPMEWLKLSIPAITNNMVSSVTPTYPRHSGWCCTKPKSPSPHSSASGS